jgi:hypothetical protein
VGARSGAAARVCHLDELELILVKTIDGVRWVHSSHSLGIG